MLLMHDERRAFSRARAKTGNKIAARMAIMAITTSNSIEVNADLVRKLESMGLFLEQKIN